MIKDPITGQLVMPVVTARIGDTWDVVQKNSTLPLKPLSFGGAGTVVEAPHNFIYRGPDHEMTLENVWYMGVSTSQFWGGEVKLDKKNLPIASISIGPYPDSANAEETWQRMQFLYQKMEAAGWIPDDDANKRNTAYKIKTASDLKKNTILCPVARVVILDTGMIITVWKPGSGWSKLLLERLLKQNPISIL